MIRVLIVDDEALVRAGIRTILQSADDIDVVGEVADGAEAEQAVARYQPDVVLMDIRMPKVDGLRATEVLTSTADAPRVIVLTTFDLDDYVFRALEVGASGFLLKDTPPRDLIHAVRVVADGEAMLSPKVTRALIGQFASGSRHRRQQAAQQQIAVLTDREREVFHAVGEGLSNGEIARKLYMSEATVKAHVSQLLSKLQASNRVQVAILAHDLGN